MNKDKEIRVALSEIANVLHKHDLLSDKDYKDFSLHINDIQSSELSHFACIFLSLTLINNKVGSATRDSFEKIYNILIKDYVSNGKRPGVHRVLNVLNNDFCPAFIDSFFERKKYLDGILIDKIAIVVPVRDKERLLEQFYYIGADIFEMVDKPFDIFPSEAVAVFEDGTRVEVYTGSYDGVDALNINEYYLKDGKAVHKIRVINKEIFPLCFESYQKNVRIETPELKFIRSLARGGEYDFISAMALKNEVNIKKVGMIRKGLSSYIKEEKKNGLQKTS